MTLPEGLEYRPDGPIHAELRIGAEAVVFSIGAAEVTGAPAELDRELEERLLGMIAHERGEFAEAERYYRDSLAISEELGNRAGIADTFHQLGSIAEERKKYAEAEELYRKSLAISEELGNRASIASSLHQLGLIAEERKKYAEAEELYRNSLAIKEELGNRHGIAVTISQLGILRTKLDQPAQGVLYNLQALTLRLEMGASLTTDLYWLIQQRNLLGDDDFERVLRTRLSDSDTEAIMRVTHQQTDPPEADET
ncbi:tetratricopeptide repeat protein [Streptomyces sp. ISL-14]|nr:tetratricopeptide repeat protein [Streptomyces sp. ISL-14]